MTALALTITRKRKSSIGDRYLSTATLTLVASSSTYVNDGTAAGSGVAMPTGWKGTLGLNIVEELWISPGLLVATNPDVTIPATIYQATAGDLLKLLGAASTASEDKPLEQLPNGYSFTDGTYTATLFAIGY